MNNSVSFLLLLLFLIFSGCNSDQKIARLEKLNSIAAEYLSRLDELQREMDDAKIQKNASVFNDLQQQATLIRFNAVKKMNDYLADSGPVYFNFVQTDKSKGYSVKNIKGVSTVWNRSKFPLLLLEAEVITIDSIKNFPAGEWLILNDNGEVTGTAKAVFKADDIGTLPGKTVKLYSNISFELTEKMYSIEIH